MPFFNLQLPHSASSVPILLMDEQVELQSFRRFIMQDPQDDLVESPSQPSTSRQPLLDPAEVVAESRSRPLAITKKRRRIGWHLLLPTLVIIALSAGSAIALLLWVTVIRGVQAVPEKSTFLGALETGAFLVNEGTIGHKNNPQTTSLLALSFSSITTEIVSLTAPWLVMMAAYCVVGLWLAEQEKPHPNDDKLPTAAQFGFLVTLSSTAGIVALYQTANYLVGACKNQRESAPRLFHLAVISVVAIYSITHSISAADLWLHLSSSTITHDIRLPLASMTAESIAQINFSQPLPPDTYFLGVVFNESLCDAWAADPSLHGGQSVSCLSGIHWSYDAPSVELAGELIALNTSFIDRMAQNESYPRLPISVVTLHNESDLAVIVSTSNSSLTWTAPTYGMRTSCRDMTDRCTNDGQTYNCSGGGYPFFIPAVDDSNSVLAFGSGSLQWELTDAGPNLTHIKEPGPFVSNVTEVWNPSEDPYVVQLALILEPPGEGYPPPTLMACQVEYFNLTIRHEPNGIYGVVKGTLTNSSDYFAGVMSGPLLSGVYLSNVANNIQAIGSGYNGTDDGFVAALNQQLARYHLAIFAGSVIPAPALSIFQPTLISRYRAAPLLIYVSLLFLYAILVLIIFSWASRIESAVVRAPDGKETTSLELGQRILTNSLTLAGLVLPNTLQGVHENSPLKKPVDMFGEVPEKQLGEDGASDEESTRGIRRRVPRIILDVVDEGPKAGMIFGVRELKGLD